MKSILIHIKCKTCGKSFVKKTSSHKFCCLKCKDRFWNSQPHRIDRSIRYSKNNNISNDYFNFEIDCLDHGIF